MTRTHYCPAASAGQLWQVSVEGLRNIGHFNEADRLEAAMHWYLIWNNAAGSENAVALSLFGCCEHARLGRLIFEQSVT